MASTKLEFEGDVQKALAEIRKVTAENAKLREETRKLKEESVKGAEASAKAVDKWAVGVRNLKQAQAEAAINTAAWANGMKRLKDQADAAYNSLRKVGEGMGSGKSVGGGAAWAAGIKSISDQYQKSSTGANAWAAGLANIRNQQQSVGRAQQDYLATLTRSANPLMDMTAATGALSSASSMALTTTLGLAGGIGAVTSVAGAAVSAYQMYRAELEKLAAAQQDFHKDLVRDIALTRDFAQGAEIEKFAGSVPGATRGEVLSTFQGVTAEAPTADLQRRLGVAGAGARLGVTGQDMGAFGRLSGSLAGILPDEKPEDVADIAAIVSREAGGDISKLGGTKFQRSIQQLIASGAMTQDEALAAGLAAAQGKISPETLGQMAQTAFASKDSLLPGRGERGPEAAAKRRMAFASPRERIAMMRETNLEVSRLSPEAMAANVGMIQGARREDTIGGILGGIQKSAAGQGIIAQRTFEKEGGRRNKALARNEELSQQVDEFVRAKNAGRGMLVNAATEASIFHQQVGRTMSAGMESTTATEARNIGLEALVSALQANTAALADSNRKRPVKNIDAHKE